PAFRDSWLVSQFKAAKTPPPTGQRIETGPSASLCVTNVVLFLEKHFHDLATLRAGGPGGVSVCCCPRPGPGAACSQEGARRALHVAGVRLLPLRRAVARQVRRLRLRPGQGRAYRLPRGLLQRPLEGPVLQPQVVGARGGLLPGARAQGA